jgi:hypothetical protein
MKLGVFGPMAKRAHRLDHAADGPDGSLRPAGQWGLVRRALSQPLPKAVIQQMFTSRPTAAGQRSA